jgi:hypothetical protein
MEADRQSHFFPVQKVILIVAYFLLVSPHLINLVPGLLIDGSECSLQVGHRMCHVQCLVGRSHYFVS